MRAPTDGGSYSDSDDDDDDDDDDDGVVLQVPAETMVNGCMWIRNRPK